MHLCEISSRDAVGVLEDARLVVLKFEESIANQSNDAFADESQSGECNIVVPRDVGPQRRLELTALENRDRLQVRNSACHQGRHTLSSS